MNPLRSGPGPEPALFSPSFQAVLVIVAAIGIGGCASSSASTGEENKNTPSPVSPINRSVVKVGSYAPVEIINEAGIGVRTLPASARTTWGVLGGIYAELDIPVTHSDPRSMQLGNPNFRLAKRVGGKRMNTFIDCGTNFSGPLANQYDITLSVMTKLTAKGDESTEVLTLVDAHGRPRAVSGNTVHCQSRGVLEKQIAQLVAEALGTSF